MHKKTEVICGISDLKPNFEEIGNNPNFVFENDPNFETIKLFDIEGNIVNVNSWLECANYVNGGWTNNISDFVDGEKILFFFLTVLLTIGFVVEKKYGIFTRV
tara:strand:- start:186 stop:494 length:309 start_codon:yes stop_codon:yes gene_type:complete